MNRKLRSWQLLTIPALILVGTGASGCDKVKEASEAACGPCGSIATGDVSVTSNAQIDGFFQALGTLNAATAQINGDFEANLKALAGVYGAKVDGSLDAIVTDLKAKVQADVTANVDGGLNINFKPPQCQASVDVAVQAQAQCEAKAECDVKVDPGRASVECKGGCTGTCSGKCTGDLSCSVTAPTVNCEGTCAGTCELSAAATCEGTCHGKCNGTCSAQDGSGQCNGTCSGGTCEGSCELKAEAKCTGTCHGTCHVDQGSAQCKGDVQCNGSCDAKCEGSCKGEFKPPSASGSCDASAKCEAQASARANASFDCTPPSLDISYSFKAGVKADAQATFVARLGELKVRGAAIMQGFARLQGLVDGKIDGKVVFNPSPVAQVKASFGGLIEGAADLNIPAGRISCLAGAVDVAVTQVGEIGGTVTGTLAAQAKFASIITG